MSICNGIITKKDRIQNQPKQIFHNLATQKLFLLVIYTVLVNDLYKAISYNS